MRFEGKNIVVTGGTGALGAAVVTQLIAEGGRCFVPVHRKKETPIVKGPGSVEYVEGIDLTDEPAVESFYKKIGPLWASIHTAGGFAMAPIETIKKVDFVSMMQMNALSAFLCCREAVKAIRAAGAGGRIVNVAAKPAITPVGGMIPYSASKAAVASITQSLSEELARESIWVNAVIPSVMDTPINRSSFPPTTDFSKWPKVDEVAATIVFLASPDNKVTRGALVPVYGKT